jgi:succinate dehydrogenase hydrophobic anchor subunit
MNNKTLTITGSILIVLVISIIGFFVFSANKKPAATTNTQVVVPENRTNSELTRVIIASHPELSVNGKAAFLIDTVKKPKSGWYIVTIYNTDDPQKLNAARVLLHDYSRGLELVLGPGTSFSAEQTQAFSVPSSVAEELNK